MSAANPSVAVIRLLVAVLMAQGICGEGVPCYQDALNTAVDLVLYHKEQTRENSVPIPEIKKSIRGLLKIFATNGTVVGIRTMRRVGNYFTDFIDEEMKNRDKPVDKNIMMSMQAEFTSLWLEYKEAKIKFGWCETEGSLKMTVHNSLFEFIAVTSEKHSCLFDLKLIRFHKFGPVEFSIDSAKGWICPQMTEAVFNKLLTWFSDYTRSKVRELVIAAMYRKYPTDDGHICVSPYFDVVFV